MKKLLLVSAFLMAVPAAAQAQAWERLGERAISFTAEKDTIYTRHKGSFKGLKFVITRNAVNVIRMHVTFANNQRITLNVNRVFRPGQSSGYIDMPGARRVIKHVQFIYKTVGRERRGEAHVVLYGRT